MTSVRASIAALASLAISLALACGGSPEAVPTPSPVPTATATPAPPPTATPVPTSTPLPPTPLPPAGTPSVPPPAGADGGRDPDELLRGSAEAMAQVDSFHFDVSGRISVSTGGAAAAEIPISYVGDVQAPDRTKGKLALSVFVFALEMEIVNVDGVTYTTNPQTGEWGVAESGTPGVPNPAGLVRGGESLLTRATYIGLEVRDGVPVHHLAGIARLDELADVEDETTADVWIGTEDLLIREVEVEAPVDLEAFGLPAGGAGLTGSGVVALSIRLSGYGEPVSIEAPIVP